MRKILALLATSGLAAFLAPTPAAEPSVDERILQAAKVNSDDASLLEFFRSRTVSDLDAAKIRALIKQMGDDTFAVREQASLDLVRLGRQAEPLLQEALKDPDVEIARRAEQCLRMIRTGAGAAVDTAAARLLAARKPAGAAGVVLNYFPFAANHLVAEEIIGTLSALALRDGQPDQALSAGLLDKLPQRRWAAAVALCRAGAKDAQPAVRKLLRDADLTVRLQTALALAEMGETDAVAALIELLPELARGQAWQAEDVLFRLAGNVAPKASLGTDDAGRKQCQAAWADWWGRHNAQVDLSVLKPAPGTGRTMVVHLDLNRIQELDADGKVLWQLLDLQFPLDAQALPGARVLVAEHGGNRVTERDHNGKVHWQKELGEGALVCQRLANGNTFIATASAVLEVGKDGKETFSYRRPLETIRKAQKMANGDIALVTSGQRFIRLNSEGKELQSFEADVRTNGGRVDALPNGHVLIPLKDMNKVVEYDALGRVVWEAQVSEPIAALRLANGHTLITTLNQNRAIELDGAAREVWEYKSDTRVTRAWRR